MPEEGPDLSASVAVVLSGKGHWLGLSFEIFFFFKYLFYVCKCFTCMYECVHTTLGG